MLEFTIVTSFLLHKYVDVYLITGLMFFNAIIGFAQERKARGTLLGLRGRVHRQGQGPGFR